jgi:F0F1-type ATP synthase assembly protein I
MQHPTAFTAQINHLKFPAKRPLIGLVCGILLGMGLELWVTGATGLGIIGFALIGMGIGCCASRRK